MSTREDSLKDRYGAPSLTGRILVTVIGGAIVLAGLVWLGWATVFNADPPVKSEMIANDVLDDHTATVTVRLQYGDGPVETSCLVRAIAHDKVVVGEVTVHPDPDEGPDHTFEFNTDRLATAVDWVGCTAEGQPRPQ
ncbi:DUF4307 domain-containing protein [Nocardioides sambongensis]|uniref:DUF4307 domain-containing protein n=1 Tax=Nocardioides sambongensis TaxID=2589074 RepID=UPI0015E82D32|nr:DUF4307 domain-containing protein [Nocardioides sambongensis]